VLFQAPFDEGEGERSPVDGDVHLRQQKGDAADVVLVTVGEEQAADHSAVFLEVVEIGGDDVNAEEFGIGEHHAGVDDDDVVAVADGHAVHAEFAEAAERDYLQFLVRHRWG
jgi:hypothetical protein